MREAREQLMAFMRTQVRERKMEIQGQDGDKNDVFTMLVKANESESEKLKLDDQELVRTCSTFLLLH
jgi:cytochrome P450